jgi:hypothetical protein
MDHLMVWKFSASWPEIPADIDKLPVIAQTELHSPNK